MFLGAHSESIVPFIEYYTMISWAMKLLLKKSLNPPAPATYLMYAPQTEISLIFGIVTSRKVLTFLT